jgi:hypothetical protein
MHGLIVSKPARSATHMSSRVVCGAAIGATHVKSTNARPKTRHTVQISVQLAAKVYLAQVLPNKDQDCCKKTHTALLIHKQQNTNTNMAFIPAEALVDKLSPRHCFAKEATVAKNEPPTNTTSIGTDAEWASVRAQTRTNHILIALFSIILIISCIKAISGIWLDTLIISEHIQQQNNHIPYNLYHSTMQQMYTDV